MLQNLYVKNLALIDEAEVDFSGGLNILTGETGAGKSIILGSVSLALGGRYSADMLRKGADKGLVELTFYVENPETVRKLEEMDLSPDGGQIIITRRFNGNRSVSRINVGLFNCAMTFAMVKVLPEPVTPSKVSH